ncbi:MAG: glycosyltransferase family 2 protein [Ilumatobacteraceae bacterium]
MTEEWAPPLPRGGRQTVKGSLAHGGFRRVSTRFPAILDACAFTGPKTFSAIVRVKNEEQYLGAAVGSIVDLVEEVVIVDNLSTDRTPEIIGELVVAHPGRVRALAYPHELARYGEENAALAETPKGRRSPRLIANFYNWTLKQSAHPFVLKWDGDTIATAELGRALDDFRDSSAQTLWHIGANLHPDGQHLIAPRPFEEPEPRLFYKRWAHYNNGLIYCEMLKSPYVDLDKYRLSWTEPVYVHMKYCKRVPFLNMSNDLQRQAIADTRPGPPIDDDVRSTIRRWGLMPEREGR